VKYGGTPEIEALNFVTLNPAKQLKIDSHVGSLEVGKDGDFAIWTKSHSIRQRVLQTWIEGKKYFDAGNPLNAPSHLRKNEWILLAKAEEGRGHRSGGVGGDASDAARQAFFFQALEQAHGLGVIDLPGLQNLREGQ